MNLNQTISADDAARLSSEASERNQEEAQATQPVTEVKPPDPYLQRRKKYSWWILNLGTLVVALGVHLFRFPNHFAMGGVTGMAIVLGQIIPGLTPAWTTFGLNLLLLVIGYIVLGKGIAFKTAYVCIVSSILQVLFERFLPMNAPLTDETLLELFFAIFLSAFGSALLFNENASSGGTDIIAIIVRKYSSMDIGHALLATDIVIGLSTFFIFDIKTCLFSVAGIFLRGVVVDSFIATLNRVKYCTIICEKADEIGGFITNTLHRGCTHLSGEGFYTKQSCSILLTVLTPYQATMLHNFIRKTEPDAFMMMTSTSEIMGRGFHRPN